MKDERAPWCGLNHLHGPHGAKSKTPCPGYEPPRPTKRRGPHMSTRADVLAAVRRYQAALFSIGIEGAATVAWGSAPNGVSHALEFRSPDLQHPEVESLGRTYRQAEAHVSSMAAAIEFTSRQMKRQKVEAAKAYVRQAAATGFVEPDARSRTRAAEESYPIRHLSDEEAANLASLRKM